MLTDRQRQQLQDMIRDRATELGMLQKSIVERSQQSPGKGICLRTVGRMFSWSNEDPSWTPHDITLGQMSRALDWPTHHLAATVRAMKEVNPN